MEPLRVDNLSTMKVKLLYTSPLMEPVDSGTSSNGPSENQTT